ncbi:metal-dependent transcriptional regulator [Jeotgalibaca caeni]|uniref:metal-dependent transcriptional regulator n=1 Tax=Jeotgalibaca caeni TaxID=3028623 RepID=UPI00237DF04C|nr:metal-dependent transcriptional regulator [Jeotgalibaca caeni]MDE1548057.1 metal-dependent transcriptional regulator [Jeotgalibaca caeni]
MTPQKEDYLKVIIELGGDKDLINNKLIGQALSVTAASVTEMSTKLLKDGYIIHVPYQGVQLSEKGLKVANQMIRKHRLWETFLANHLGFTWDEVHDLAEKLEHVSSNVLIDRLDEFLGFPTSDPHGGLIPDREGRTMDKDSLPLQELAEGDGFFILEVDDDAEFLKYLSEKNIRLDQYYRVDKMEAFEGPVYFRDEKGNEYQVSYKAAAKLLVEKQ